MKRFITLLAVITCAAMVGASTAQPCRSGAGRNYNPATVETVSGKIAGVISVKGIYGRSGGTHLTLVTEKETVSIHLGPSWFLSGKISLEKNDSVTVEGSRIASGKGQVIIAKKITKADTTVTLRNDNGVPLWAGKGNRKRAK